MFLKRKTRRNREEGPDRRKRILRDLEDDDWMEDLRHPGVDFEDELLDDDLSDMDWGDDSVN